MTDRRTGGDIKPVRRSRTERRPDDRRGGQGGAGPGAHHPASPDGYAPNAFDFPFTGFAPARR